MIKEYLDKYKYQLGGSIIFLAVSYIVKKNFFDKDLILEEIKPKKEKKIIKKEEDISVNEFSGFMKTFKNELRNLTQSLLQFNANQIKNMEYKDFRDKLFTKDILKKNILIDTITLKDRDTVNTSNYKINFGEDNYPDKFKNVIGFRLINAVIPNTFLRVNSNNKTIKYHYNGDNTLSFSLDEGIYTFESLGDHLTIKLSFLTGASVTYDTNTYKYNLTWTDSNNFGFLWRSSNNSAYKLFGAQNKDFSSDMTSGDQTNFPNSADQSIHFVDVVVPEIPSIACKFNSSGKNIIERIPLNYPNGSLSLYTSPDHSVQTQNYFYPIKLASLTIQLYDDYGNLYDNSDADHYLEFEITIVENTKLFT